MNLRICIPDDGNVLQLSGKLDIYAAGQLHAALIPRFAGGFNVELEMSDVQAIDIAGLQILVATAQSAAAAGRAFTVRGAPESLKACCDSIGLPTDIFSSTALIK